MISLPLDEYPIVCAFWMPKSSRVPIGTYGLQFCCWLNVLRSNQRSSEGLQWNTCVPMGPAVFFFCFLIFSRFLPLLGQDPNKNLQKTNEKKHSNVSALVPAGLEVFFLHPHFFATFGRRQNESLRASLAEIDRYLHLFVSEMLAFRIQFHCKVVLHIFSFETTRCCKVKEVSNGMADWPAADWGEFIDLMKHSTPFEDGKENGIIGDDSSWVHYNWPEVANDMSSYWRFSINGGFLL